MRKLAICAAAATLAVALVPGPATGAKAKKQEVSGSLVAGLTHTDGGCYAGVHRRIAVLTMEAANGDVGYHFDVDPATAGKPFVLEPTGGGGTPDLDILFYNKFGTPEEVATDPTAAGAPSVIAFEDHAVGGETGIVPPKEYSKAIVCFNMATAPAANVTFTYTAGKGIKPPK